MELIVTHGDRREAVHLERAEHGWRIHVGERTYEVDSVVAGGVLRSLVIDGRQTEVAVEHRRNGEYQVSTARGIDAVEILDPLTHLAREAHQAGGGAGASKVTAYMPGRVVEILVKEGDEVAAGQGVVVLEAMKMKNEILAESAGVVRKIAVETGQAVEGGDLLFEIA